MNLHEFSCAVSAAYAIGYPISTINKNKRAIAKYIQVGFKNNQSGLKTFFKIKVPDNKSTPVT